jgi:hypothetical protein
MNQSDKPRKDVAEMLAEIMAEILSMPVKK